MQIDTWNENRQQEKKIERILQQVNEDLSINIVDSRISIELYASKDSIVRQLILGKVPFDVIRNNISIRTIMYRQPLLSIKDQGYNLLKQELDNIPEKYESILSDLNFLYINERDTLKKYEAIVFEIIDEYTATLRRDKNWYSDSYLYKKIPSDEEINFYLEDPYFKNCLTDYFQNGIISNTKAIIKFRNNSICVYKKISRLLNHENKEVNDTQFIENNDKRFNHLKGNYLANSNKVYKMKIYDKGGLLFSIFDNHTVKEIFPLSDKSFYYEEEGPKFGFIGVNERGKTKIIIRTGFDILEFNKVD